MGSYSTEGSSSNSLEDGFCIRKYTIKPTTAFEGPIAFKTQTGFWSGIKVDVSYDSARKIANFVTP
jgi:hypothetical protein